MGVHDQDATKILRESFSTGVAIRRILTHTLQDDRLEISRDSTVMRAQGSRLVLNNLT